MKRVYYNENDPKAAAWLKELICGGYVADGDVDERSITEVRAADLAGYRQVHLFAGIGGWSVACRLAGIQDDEEIWTGSCPCPPFSSAGKKKSCVKCGGRPFPCPWLTGHFTCSVCDHSWLADARHLWPEMWRLVAEFGPARVFGEQVASDDGRIWLAGVRSTVEQVGYDFGASDLCAAGVGSPQIRQRLYWVGYANGVRRGEGAGQPGQVASSRRGKSESAESGGADGMGKSDGQGSQNCTQSGSHRRSEKQRARGSAVERSGAVERLADASRGRCDQTRERLAQAGCDGLVGNRGAGSLDQSGRDGSAAGISAPKKGREESANLPDHAGHAAFSGRMGDSLFAGLEGHAGRDQDGAAATAGASGLGFWNDFDLLPCTDGKARRIEPGSFPLAHGVPGRVGLLRGYGNAIVPQQAALFIQAAEKVRHLVKPGNYLVIPGA